MESITMFTGVIEKVTTLSDHSLKISVATQEIISPEENAKIFNLYNKLMWFAVSEAPVDPTSIELPDIKLERGEKSPSERMRGVLYILWEQSKNTLTFEQFYREQMSRITDKLKEKIND